MPANKIQKGQLAQLREDVDKLTNHTSAITATLCGLKRDLKHHATLIYLILGVILAAALAQLF